MMPGKNVMKIKFVQISTLKYVALAMVEEAVPEWLEPPLFFFITKLLAITKFPRELSMLIYIIYFDWWSWDSFYESFTFTNRLMGYVIFYKRFLELAAFKKITYGKSLCPTWSFIYKSFYFY